MYKGGEESDPESTLSARTVITNFLNWDGKFSRTNYSLNKILKSI